jgi:hypothetical protein
MWTDRRKTNSGEHPAPDWCLPFAVVRSGKSVLASRRSRTAIRRIATACHRPCRCWNHGASVASGSHVPRVAAARRRRPGGDLSRTATRRYHPCRMGGPLGFRYRPAGPEGSHGPPLCVGGCVVRACCNHDEAGTRVGSGRGGRGRGHTRKVSSGFSNAADRRGCVLPLRIHIPRRTPAGGRSCSDA